MCKSVSPLFSSFDQCDDIPYSILPSAIPLHLGRRLFLEKENTFLIPSYFFLFVLPLCLFPASLFYFSFLRVLFCSVFRFLPPTPSGAASCRWPDQNNSSFFETILSFFLLIARSEKIGDERASRERTTRGKHGAKKKRISNVCDCFWRNVKGVVTTAKKNRRNDDGDVTWSRLLTE